MSLATAALQHAGAIAAPTAIPTSSATPAAATGAAGSGNALATLSGNFQNFLHLLLTQLKNQDPTSPLDTNQFTTELVQFTSVEQQISTNANLSQLIQLTQGDTVIQSSALLGKTVVVQSSALPLQNGAATVEFTGTQGQKIAIAIGNAAGTVLKTVQVTASQGTNTWKWDGVDNAGNSLADGAYTVSVVGAGTAGAVVPFGVVGTATGVQVQNNAVQLQLGGVTVPFSAVQSVGAPAGATAAKGG